MKRSPLPSGKEWILVVDDDPGVLRYTKALLEIAEYRVKTANCGAEAVQLLQAGARPDLILTDMAMPGMDGLELIQACRRIRPQQKIVVLSCMTNPGLVADAMRLGALDYLSKPYCMADLEAMLKRWLAPSHACVLSHAADLPAQSSRPRRYDGTE